MRGKFMRTIISLFAIAILLSSTLAFAEPEPIGDVHLEQFSALKGIQAEPLSDSAMLQVEGKYMIPFPGFWVKQMMKQMQKNARCKRCVQA